MKMKSYTMLESMCTLSDISSNRCISVYNARVKTASHRALREINDYTNIEMTYKLLDNRPYTGPMSTCKKFYQVMVSVRYSRTLRVLFFRSEVSLSRLERDDMGWMNRINEE